jgi:hypothetical protein
MPALHEIGTFGIVAMLIGLVAFSVIGGVALAHATHPGEEKKKA